MTANNITIIDAFSAEQVVATICQANVHTPYSLAQVYINNANTSNSNPVPSLLVLANGASVSSINQLPSQQWFSSSIPALHLDGTANLVTFTTANAASVITQSSNQTNYGWRGAIFYLNLTAFTGPTVNVSVTINNIDPVSGKLYPVLVTAPTASNVAASYSYQIYPGITATANQTASLLLSRTWCANVTITGSGGNTVSGQLAATLML